MFYSQSSVPVRTERFPFIMYCKDTLGKDKFNYANETTCVLKAIVNI